MTVLITLTLAGTDTGPFNLYSNLDGYITPFETNIPKSSLVTGYTSTLVPDGTINILVQSLGNCDSQLYLVLDGASTTTTTSTSTTAIPPPTTTRIDWGVGNQSGGQLIIFNNAMSELLNITSTAGSAQNGSIYPLLTELPYTIRGKWVSGSSNIIQYRVCDITGELYLSGEITNLVGSEDYTPSPAPINAYVYLTANNVTPPICPS